MSEPTSTWIAVAVAAIGTISGWGKVLLDARTRAATAREEREGEDAAYLRKLLDDLAAEMRTALAEARREAVAAREEAAALRERVRGLEQRVEELEHENEELRQQALRQQARRNP